MSTTDRCVFALQKVPFIFTWLFFLLWFWSTAYTQFKQSCAFFVLNFLIRLKNNEQLINEEHF